MKEPKALFRLLLPALFLWAAAAYGQAPTTKLTIQVKTLTSRPIERAEVIVTFAEVRKYSTLGKNVRTSYDLRTNQEGVARIPAIPQGKVRVMVNAKGYQTFGQIFDLKEEEQTLEIKLNPPQPQYSAH